MQDVDIDNSIISSQGSTNAVQLLTAAAARLLIKLSGIPLPRSSNIFETICDCTGPTIASIIFQKVSKHHGRYKSREQHFSCSDDLPYDRYAKPLGPCCSARRVPMTYLWFSMWTMKSFKTAVGSCAGVPGIRGVRQPRSFGRLPICRLWERYLELLTIARCS